MINGMTVEDFNAREHRRASCVAKLHGYTPFDGSDTQESLKAEYEALTGEAYRTPAEEALASAEAARERGVQRKVDQLDGDHAIIAAAKANGFMDCRAVRDALGWDKPNAKGNYRSSLGIAFHWIEEADEEVVFLIPDGITDVTKSERTGCYPDVFARVLEVKEEWDADRAAREQKSWDDAQAAKDAFDQQKAAELAELIARQDADRAQRVAERVEYFAQLYAARDAQIQRLMDEDEDEDEDEQVISPARRVSIIAALRSYDGPLTKNGLPKRKPLNAHAGFKIEGWEKRECWPEVQDGS